MKKWLKHLLIIICIIMGFTVSMIFFDIINACIFNKSPIVSKYEFLGNNGYVDRGVIFDVFYCNKSSDVVYVAWKLKWSKYTCPDIEYKSMIDRVGNVFVKTYTIEKIENSNEKYYQYLTVSQYDVREKETVKVPILSEKIEVGKKYEIIFRIKSNEITNEIKSVFENAEIISIKETEKDINQFIGF